VLLICGRGDRPRGRIELIGSGSIAFEKYKSSSVAQQLPPRETLRHVSFSTRRVPSPVNVPATIPARSVQFEISDQLRSKRLLRRFRAQTTESAMSEAEFDRLLDVVRTAIAPRPYDNLRVFMPKFADQPLHTANDNEPAWPLIPFPDGWHASC
jgi:hypothetical protein